MRYETAKLKKILALFVMAALLSTSFAIISPIAIAEDMPSEPLVDLVSSPAITFRDITWHDNGEYAIAVGDNGNIYKYEHDANTWTQIEIANGNGAGEDLSKYANVTGTSADDLLGFNISYAGDVNNDGNSDTIVGAPGADEAYVFFGGTGLIGSLTRANANVILTGSASSGFGWDVASAGNIDGDAYDDVIIGAPDDDMVFIFYGSSISGGGTFGFGVADITITGENSGDEFGASVNTAGNYDNAGNDDIIVGAPGSSSDKGSAYVFYGDGSIPSSAVDADVLLAGSQVFDKFGFSVSTAGNTDGIGGDEILVGEPGKGQARLFYTPENNTVISDIPIFGNVNNDYTTTELSDDSYESIQEIATSDLYDIGTQGTVTVDPLRIDCPGFKEQNLYLESELEAGLFTDIRVMTGNANTGTLGTAYFKIWLCDVGGISILGGDMTDTGNYNGQIATRVLVFDSSSVTLTGQMNDWGLHFDIGSDVGYSDFTYDGTGSVLMDLEWSGFDSGDRVVTWRSDMHPSRCAYDIDNDGGGVADFTAHVWYTRFSINTAFTTSALEHKWAVEIPHKSACTLFMESNHTANAEGDDFTIYYSINGYGRVGDTSWTEMFTVTKTSDDDTYQTYTDSVLGIFQGFLYIGVIDNDRTSTNLVLDSIFIDQMFIQAVPFAELKTSTSQLAFEDDHSYSDIPVTGTVVPPTNGYQNTLASDDSYEEITEIQTGGDARITTYTYDGITTASGPHYAWFCDIDEESSAEFTSPNSEPEFTDQQYADVLFSDDTWAVSEDTGMQDEMFVKCSMYIEEDVASIDQIDFTFEGNCPVTCDYQIYVLNTTSTLWETVGVGHTVTADVDLSFTESLSLDFANYIQANTILWGCFRPATNCWINVDHLEAQVHWTAPFTSELEHKWSMFIPQGVSSDLYLEAYHNPNAEGDDFDVYYSRTNIGSVGGTGWTHMMTISKTADDDLYQQYSDTTLDTFSGILYIGIIDSDRTANNLAFDTVYIDHVYMRVQAYARTGLGWAVSSAGNLDDDGGSLADVLVGAPLIDNGKGNVWLNGDFEAISSIIDTSQGDFTAPGSSLDAVNPSNNVFATVDGDLNLTTTLVMSDDFENDIVGSDPDDPPWDVPLEGTNTNVEISNADSYGGSNSMMLDDDSSDDDVGCIIQSDPFAPTTSGALEFMIRAGNQGATTDQFAIMLYSSSNFRVAVGLYAGSICFQNGPTVYRQSTYVPDQWYHFKIVFDCVSDKYDFYVDGELVCNDIAFSLASDSIDSIVFTSNMWSFGDFDDSMLLTYVDDISVYSFDTPGYYDSSVTTAPQNISAIKPFWNITTPGYCTAWLNVSRDGGTIWNQTPVFNGVWYRFPYEVSGKDLRYRIEMSTMNPGYTPIVHNITIYYSYLNPPDIVLTGEAPDDKFGYSVAYAGDIGGDGIDDIIIGAPYNDNGLADAGAVYVFNGSAGLIGTISAADADYRNYSYNAGAHLGWSVAYGMDLNIDTYNDVLAGSPHFDTTNSDTGLVTIFSLLTLTSSSMKLKGTCFNGTDFLLVGDAGPSGYAFTYSESGGLVEIDDPIILQNADINAIVSGSTCAIAVGSLSGSGVVYRYDYGSETWEKLSETPDEMYQGITYNDVDKFYIVGYETNNNYPRAYFLNESEDIKYSLDDGSLPVKCMFNDISWNLNSNFGLVCGFDPDSGTNGNLFKVTVGGAWNRINGTGNTDDLRGISWKSDDSRALVVGHNATHAQIYSLYSDNAHVGRIPDALNTLAGHQLFGVDNKPFSTKPDYSLIIGASAMKVYFNLFDDSTQVTVSGEYPHIFNVGMWKKSDGIGGLSTLNQQLDVSETYTFSAEVNYSLGGVDEFLNGNNNIRINLTAWYDEGKINSNSEPWPTWTNENRTSIFSAEWEEGPAQSAAMTYPINSPTSNEFRLESWWLGPGAGDHYNIYFNITLDNQTHAGDGANFVSGPATSLYDKNQALNDPNSWDIQFRIFDADYPDAENITYEEFGIFRYTNITVSGNPSGNAPPGSDDNPLGSSQVTYSANIAHHVNVSIPRLNLTTDDSKFIPATDVAVRSTSLLANNTNTQINGSWTFGRAFPGANQDLGVWGNASMSAGYWMVPAPRNGTTAHGPWGSNYNGYGATEVEWYATVPGATAEGTYQATITFKIGYY